MSAMNLGELYKAASRALSAEPDRRALQDASSMALHLADMVSWASACIDPRGEVRVALDEIRGAARVAYERCGHAGVGTLHDAVADLADAIARHDRDLQAGNAGTGYIVDSL